VALSSQTELANSLGHSHGLRSVAMQQQPQSAVLMIVTFVIHVHTMDYYSNHDPLETEGWVGWPTADNFPHKVVTRQP